MRKVKPQYERASERSQTSGTSPALKAGPSPYAMAAASFFEMGYRPIPILPATALGSLRGAGKAPGALAPLEGNPDGAPVWQGMRDWQTWATKDLPEEMVDLWSDWPRANIGVLLDALVLALDVDVEHEGIGKAIQAFVAELGGEVVMKRGAKGFTIFMRQPESGPIANAAFSFPSDGERVLDVLSLGKQTVVPPSIHPKAGAYQWLTPQGLGEVDPDDLPQAPEDLLDKLAALLEPFRVYPGTRSKTRKLAPRRGEDAASNNRGSAEVASASWPAAGAERREKGWMSAINDRAMNALGAWVPKLELVGCRREGEGWRAVATWRASSTGKDETQRSPNLSIHPKGIVDFGDGEKGYTPINLVQCALGFMTPKEAADWLSEQLDGDFRPRVEAFAERFRQAAGSTMEPQGGAGPASALEVAEHDEDRDDDEDDEEKPDADGLTMADVYAEFPRDPGPFPVEGARGLLRGALAELTTFLEERSVSPSFQVAFGTALSFLSAASGQIYGIGDMRTNMYIVLTGPSSSGKTTALNMLKKLTVGSPVLVRLLGPAQLTSDTAAIKLIRDRGRVLLPWDEFGKKYAEFSSDRAGVWEKRLLTLLTEIFSAVGTRWGGKLSASGLEEDGEAIDDPHLSIFGAATPGQFWGGLKASGKEDGSLARILIISLDDLPDLPEERPAHWTAEDHDAQLLLEKLEAIARGPNEGNAPPGVAPTHEVGIPAELKRQIWETQRRLRKLSRVAYTQGYEMASASIGRVVEYATKIAMVNAISRNPSAPAISADDWALGFLLSKWSIAKIVAETGYKVADTDFERRCLIIIEILAAGRPEGMTIREIYRKLGTKMRARDRDEALEMLFTAGRVTSMKRPAKTGNSPGGRNATVYVLRNHPKQSKAR